MLQMGSAERGTGHILGQIPVPLAFTGALSLFTCCLTAVRCDFRCAELMFGAHFAGTQQQVVYRKGDYSQQDSQRIIKIKTSLSDDQTAVLGNALADIPYRTGLARQVQMTFSCAFTAA